MPPGARQELRSSPGAPKRAHSTRTETRAVGCGRLSQGQTMRAEGRHVPHMFPFTVELILTAVHCLLIGRPRAPSSPTAREMPRGVAVASIARLPSSTDDPSGSTADRHEPVEDWGSTRGHVHRFQSIVNSKGGKRYPRPSRLQPSRDSTPLLRTRHRCRTNPHRHPS